MNKKILWSIVSLLVIVIGCAGYYFRSYFLIDTKLIENKKTNTWAVNELISKNYNENFHALDLGNKKLGAMPDICAMVAGTHFEYDIWTIDLADNALSQINEDLSCLKNLSELNLSFNKITQIENLSELSFLKKLDLGNNEIKDIAWLERLTNLSDLHLGYNQITSTVWLEKLTNLTSLQLQSNKIEDIANLANLPRLEVLKLEFNKLDTEDVKIVIKLKKLKIITVGENPWIDPKIIERLNEFTRKNMK